MILRFSLRYSGGWCVNMHGRCLFPPLYSSQVTCVDHLLMVTSRTGKRIIIIDAKQLKHSICLSDSLPASTKEKTGEFSWQV